MKMKTYAMILGALVFLGGSNSFAVELDYEPINKDNFTQSYSFDGVVSEDMSDDYVRPGASDQGSDNIYQNPAMIEPAAGDYTFEEPNSGVGEAIF